MRLTKLFTEDNKDDKFTIHNEEEVGEYPWMVAFGYETDDLHIDIKISKLAEINSNGQMEWFLDWLDKNAEMQLRAAAHRREEQERLAEQAKDKNYEQTKLERTNKKRVGHVYILKSENGLYKIGKAINVTNRVTELCIKLPMKIELLHSFQSNDYSNAEITLHERFKDRRDVGEWFRLTDDDITILLSIKDGML